MSTTIKITPRGEHIESYQIEASDLDSLKTQAEMKLGFSILQFIKRSDGTVVVNDQKLKELIDGSIKNGESELWLDAVDIYDDE